MGTLFVVATPIGNLEDMTPRALRTLREVRVIAAEDTRHSGRLLRHFGIETPLLSYHQHNQRERRGKLLTALDQGDVALITDAGTPAVSDPGADIVQAALAAGHTVSPIPGPSAITAGVSASGLIDGPFLSVGFLPRQTGERKQLLARIAAARFPIILFESAQRLSKTLQDLSDALGNREAVVLRELTKIHEEIRAGSLTSLRRWASEVSPPGEVVLVVAGAGERATTEGDVSEVVADLRRAGLSASQAAREAAAITGISRSELYRLAQAWQPASVGLEGELSLANEDALQDPLGNEECPKRR